MGEAQQCLLLNLPSVSLLSQLSVSLVLLEVLVEGLEDMVEIITMRSLILSTSSMEYMMISITQTLEKKDLVMKLAILRESTMYTFLMGGSSMSSIMLMATMVVLSWRSSMMEKHIILNTLGMVDMCNTVHSPLICLHYFYNKIQNLYYI